MKRIILSLFAVLFCLTSFCQIGAIKGNVFDKRKKQGLAYANILLKTTKAETPRISSITDANGNFMIDSVPVGKYNLTVSFIAYGDSTIEGLIIAPDTALTVKLVLPPYCEFDKYQNEKTCPVCGRRDKVVSIIYGLPVGKMDEEKYYYAGCVVTFCQPNWYCKRDKYKF